MKVDLPEEIPRGPFWVSAREERKVRPVGNKEQWHSPGANGGGRRLGKIWKSTDLAWFALNSVSSTPTNTACVCARARARAHTHTHIHTYQYTHTHFLFNWKLTLNCSIQGTKILLSHPKKWQVAISHHVVLTRGGRRERDRRRQNTRGLDMLRLCSHTLPPTITPHPCHTACCTCSEKWAYTQSTPPSLSPGTSNMQNLWRE